MTTSRESMDSFALRKQEERHDSLYHLHTRHHHHEAWSKTIATGL